MLLLNAFETFQVGGAKSEGAKSTLFQLGEYFVVYFSRRSRSIIIIYSIKINPDQKMLAYLPAVRKSDSLQRSCKCISERYLPTTGAILKMTVSSEVFTLLWVRIQIFSYKWSQASPSWELQYLQECLKAINMFLTWSVQSRLFYFILGSSRKKWFLQLQCTNENKSLWQSTKN